MHRAGLEEGGLSLCGSVPCRIQLGDQCTGRKHTWEQLRRTGLFIRGKSGIYAPVQVARVSGARFVWLCTIGQGRGVERCFIYILQDCRVMVGEAL